MSLPIKVFLLLVAIAAAALAGHAHARRREHPRFVHHSIGYVVVALLAASSLLLFGPE